MKSVLFVAAAIVVAVLVAGCVGQTQAGANQNVTALFAPRCYEMNGTWLAQVSVHDYYSASSQSDCEDWLSGKAINATSCELTFMQLIGICYGSIAATLRDSSICDMTGWRDRCLQTMALGLRNITICELINDSATQSVCVGNFY